jgi:hypothetical protein
MFGKLRRKTAVCTDARVSTMKDILHGIRGVKAAAWEAPFAQKIESLRAEETKNLLYTAYYKSLNISFFFGMYGPLLSLAAKPPPSNQHGRHLYQYGPLLSLAAKPPSNQHGRHLYQYGPLLSLAAKHPSNQHGRHLYQYGPLLSLAAKPPSNQHGRHLYQYGPLLSLAAKPPSNQHGRHLYQYSAHPSIRIKYSREYHCVSRPGST